MTASKKKDIALIIGLLIPVLMILFIAGAIYLPRIFTTVDPPTYDFLYMVGYPYYGDARYLVKEHHLIREELPPDQRYPPPTPGYEVWFYHHRVSTNTSHQLVFQEAATLRLDSAPTSPDGFSVVPGRKSELFFPVFTTADHRSHYLQQGSSTSKLELATGQDAASHRFTFLGWIIDDRPPPLSPGPSGPGV